MADVTNLRTKVIVCQVKSLQVLKEADFIRKFLQFVVAKVKGCDRGQMLQVLSCQAANIVVANLNFLDDS